MTTDWHIELEKQKRLDIATLSMLSILKGKTEGEIRDLYSFYSSYTASASWLHLRGTKNFEAWVLRMRKLFM